MHAGNRFRFGMRFRKSHLRSQTFSDFGSIRYRLLATESVPTTPHPTARCPMPPPPRANPQYPPKAELRRVLKAITDLNHFSLEQVLKPASSPACAAQRADCCIVQHLPVRPPGGASTARYVYGIDSDGYVLVRARSSSARRVWPQTSAGEPLPVRLHRWMLQVRPGVDTLHACDTPGCIARCHLTSGSRSANMADCWRRQRRLPQPSCPAPPTPRLQPPPALPAHDTKVAHRERIFVLAGFSSPTKLARTLLRKKKALARDSPAMGLSFQVTWTSHSNASHCSRGLFMHKADCACTDPVSHQV